MYSLCLLCNLGYMYFSSSFSSLLEIDFSGWHFISYFLWISNSVIIFYVHLIISAQSLMSLTVDIEFPNFVCITLHAF